jgi:hypothetical protein
MVQFKLLGRLSAIQIAEYAMQHIETCQRLIRFFSPRPVAPGCKAVGKKMPAV